MYDFIFLGIIPGTHIQVTFSVWLLVAGLLVATVTTRRRIRTRAWHFPNDHGKFVVPARR
jgi:hypothetical protein